MIPKMGRDSQGSTLVIFFKFIYCFIYFLQVHLLLYLPALSYLLLSFIALNIFIALFTFTTYL